MDLEWPTYPAKIVIRTGRVRKTVFEVVWTTIITSVSCSGDIWCRIEEAAKPCAGRFGVLALYGAAILAGELHGTVWICAWREDDGREVKTGMDEDRRKLSSS